MPYSVTEKACWDAEGELRYVVALKDCIVTASQSELAPDVEPGDAVQFTAAPGETTAANVVEAAAASWCVVLLFITMHLSTV